MNLKLPKIAFIGWNPFQLIHVSALIKQIPNSTFILENKHNSYSQFDKKLLSQPDLPIHVYKSRDIHKLDNLYDVIVCQTPFTDIHKFEKAKIAMIQYGYAKEPHNHGPWRSMADVCFTYGPYSSKNISYFCPTVEIGHLRKSEVENILFMIDAREEYEKLLDPNKKTIVYLPTWGEFNSSKKYLNKILSLQKNYNILVKLHHNTDLLGLNISPRLQQKTKNILGANDDSLKLIAISDVVISDYSGAIFDAIFCKKPIILVNSSVSFKDSDKFYEHSIEHRHRNELGDIVDSPDDLVKAIENCLSKNKKPSLNNFYKKLYNTDENNTSELIYRELMRLVKMKHSGLSQQQKYIRYEIKKLYKMKYSSLQYNAFNLFFGIYSKITKKNNI